MFTIWFGFCVEDGDCAEFVEFSGIGVSFLSVHCSFGSFMT